MSNETSALTGDLFSYEYGCRHRPFHGGDTDAIERAGNRVHILTVDETPAGYRYAFRTVSPVDEETRKHFDLVIL